MIFNYNITIPANTPQNNPIRRVLKLTYGIIHFLEILSSYGCAGMVYCAIYEGEHQVFPTNPDDYFRLTGVPIQGREFYPIVNFPFELEFRGWSPGTRYEHVVTVRLWMLRPWELMPFSEYMWQARGL